MTTFAKKNENLTASNRIYVDGISVSISVPKLSVLNSVLFSRFFDLLCISESRFFYDYLMKR